MLISENVFDDSGNILWSQLVTSPFWAQELSFEHLVEIASTYTQVDNKQAFYETCLWILLPPPCHSPNCTSQPFGMPLSLHNTFALTTYNCDLCFAGIMVVRNGKTIITCNLADKALGPGLPESQVVVALCLVGHVGFVSWTSQVIHRGRPTAANFQSGTSPAESECSARHNEQTSIGLERLGCRRIASLVISGNLRDG
jgi:hypothetical protein